MIANLEAPNKPARQQNAAEYHPATAEKTVAPPATPPLKQMPNPAGIPHRLREIPQWAVWKEIPRENGKNSKVPIDRRGEPLVWSRPRSWLTFSDSIGLHGSGIGDGVGLVLSAKAGIACVDLDGGYDAQARHPTAFAESIINELASYTEISVSNTGLHIFVDGQIPAAMKLDTIEVYSDKRFMAITGRRLDGTPASVEQRHDALNTIYRRIRPDLPARSTVAPAVPLSLTDGELIDRAMSARNGAKFRRLWSGDCSGYPSQSEADLALCGILLHWCGPDAQRIAALFRSSGLGRRRKSAERIDYVPRTVAVALSHPIAHYRGGNKSGSGASSVLRQQNKSDTHKEHSGGGFIGAGGGVDKEQRVAAKWPRLIERAKANLPDLGRSKPMLRLVAGICRELAWLRADGHFYLACRTVQEHTRIPYKSAARYLKRLCKMGMIELVHPGTYETMLGSEYRWICDAHADSDTSASFSCREHYSAPTAHTTNKSGAEMAQ